MRERRASRTEYSPPAVHGRSFHNNRQIPSTNSGSVELFPFTWRTLAPPLTTMRVRPADSLFDGLIRDDWSVALSLSELIDVQGNYQAACWVANENPRARCLHYHPIYSNGTCDCFPRRIIIVDATIWRTLCPSSIVPSSDASIGRSLHACLHPAARDITPTPGITPWT